MDTIVSQVRELAKNADDTGRKQLLDSLKDLHREIETPYDALWRFYGLQLQLTMARTAIDMGVFEALEESKEAVSVDEIAQKLGAAPDLLGRILRYLAAERMVKETSKNHFTANTLTGMLADKNYQGGICHFFDCVNPSLAALPGFLKETKYADITDNTNTAFQKAFDTDLPGFVWFPNQPKLFADFQRFMTVQRHGAISWLSKFPLKEFLGNFHGSPILVDVGGGFGHQCIALKEAFPDFAGKLQLQDLPQTLELVQPIPGVEIKAHNFFEPQSTKGAKFYYLRNIIHDWPDDKALIILKNLIPALGPESCILIDDMVLPNEKVHWHAAQQDLIMMSSLASRERTKDQWYALLSEAGLKAQNIFEYAPMINNSIIVAVPK